MSQVESFLQRISALPTGPGVSLDGVLLPSLEDEAELRRLFATDRNNTRLDDPYVGLVDVFAAPPDIRITRARVVKDYEDLSAKHVMPLSESQRRKEGSPAMTDTLEDFKRNWAIFTENSLSQLIDWNNVVAAGGSVLACLTPLPTDFNVSHRNLRKYFHSAAFPTSDVDLFLWGLTPEQAEIKMNSIFEAIRDSVPWDVTCVRTKHTVSIHSQYPYRSIQIVLRLYKSPAEILAGFDVDAPCCAYDGNRVWANPRAIVAMMRQCNTIDITRRSPSYEVRLAKYSSRDFEVFVPNLRRSDIDPTIYERSIVRIEGLARLLVFEKLKDTVSHRHFQGNRRTLRGRPDATDVYSMYSKREHKLRGDLKAVTSIGGLDMPVNDYDVASLHIPYGPRWDAKRIDKLVYATDLGMNSTFNPKNKGRRIHRHPAFFGTMKECLEDCCGHCPEVLSEEEKKLQQDEDKAYIRNRVSFIDEDPGRQSMSGSFNPIDVGEWAGQVYIGQTEKFFAAIAAGDRDAVARMLRQGMDVNRRDHVGRAPLHVAIIFNSIAIACDLISAGARMTARLVDGRSSLHLAAQMDQLVVIRKLFERSAINAERAKDNQAFAVTDIADNKASASETDRRSSQDDWSSDEDGEDSPVEQKKPIVDFRRSADAGDIPEDQIDQPDVLDVNLTDWDFAMTPLMYAVLYGSPSVVEELLSAGGDPKIVSQSNYRDMAPFHPLALATIASQDDRIEKIVERLLIAGASSSATDDKALTIFHRAVAQNNTRVVSTLLRCDPNAGVALNFPVVTRDSVIFPVVTAIWKGNYAMLALLLAHGVKVEIAEEDISRAHAAYSGSRYTTTENIMHEVYSPAETAITRLDDVIQLLVALGAEINLSIKSLLHIYVTAESRLSLIDWVRRAIARTSKQTLVAAADNTVKPLVTAAGWLGHFALRRQEIDLARTKKTRLQLKEETIEEIAQRKNYLIDVERLLVSRRAKTWKEISSSTEPNILRRSFTTTTPRLPERPCYFLLTTGHSSASVPKNNEALYDQLYEACFTGDNEKIQQLCLPAAGTKSKLPPIQISVRTARENQSWPYNTWTHNSVIGFTPLHVAVANRHWETARLILAIAKAQYVPEEVKEKFSIKDIALDVDSNNDSGDDEDDSGDTPIEKAIDFTDIAKRSSTVRCRVPPMQMLHKVELECEANGEIKSMNLCKKAIVDDDLEAFVNILEMYKSLQDEDKSNDEVVPLYLILEWDRVEILDEFIRRTGSGIDVKITRTDETAAPPKSKKKLYLGLSVHGKKRTDLAKKNDPNPINNDENLVPLLWSAASVKARNIVEYLSGDRPLAAYRFYSATHSDAIAERLRAAPDLETVLLKWMGWDVNILNESPLTAAILGKNLDVVKIMFSKYPQLMKSYLHNRIKFLGYNPLMLALDRNADLALVDFLLAKGISVVETDTEHGYNIFHILCDRGHLQLLDHMLRKLPRNITESLLVRQSKLLETPLHIAVIGGRTGIVQSLLNFTESSTLLFRNMDGAMPLHLSIKYGFAKITELLVQACPVEALSAENGIGETPLEMATFQDLLWRTRFQYIKTIDTPGTLGADGGLAGPTYFNNPTTGPKYFDLATQEVEIPKLRKTIDLLFEDGRLKKGTKVATELLAFVVSMEAKLATTKAKPAPKVEEKKSDEAKVEQADSVNTLVNVKKAITGRGAGVRGLVNLVDVQKLVQRNLARVDSAAWRFPVLYRDNDEPIKQSVMSREKNKSLVFCYIRSPGNWE